MEKFGFSGLWKSIGTSVIALALGVGDAVISYLNVVALPTWAHALVGVAAAILAFYKGQPKPVAQLVPPAP